MGFGGNLIWSGVIKEIHLHDKVKPVICLKPNISDLLSGFLYDRYSGLNNDPIFIHNPRVTFAELRKNKKPFYWRSLDFIFRFLIHQRFIHLLFENIVFKLSEMKHKKQGIRLVHVDMRIHSYALCERNRRMFWKTGGHAIQIIAKRFGIECKAPDCELKFTTSEELHVDNLILNHRLDRFIVVDPNTNQDWFGELRSWPLQSWQDFINIFVKKYPMIKVVQVGLPGKPLLNQVVDFRGKTSFRQAAILIRRSLNFIGTEGGLMHAAKAVNANALILWGGVTLPEFTGYPNSHKIICKYVACAPCGNLGWCNNSRMCMFLISVEEVIKAISEIVDNN